MTSKQSCKLSPALLLLLLCLALCLCLAGCGEDGGSANPLAGTAWIAANDGSQWVFRDDGSFAWYRDKANTADNYYAGTYEARQGEAALDFLEDELADFNHTREGAEYLIQQNQQFDKRYNTDNFICLSCNNTSFMFQGEERLSEPLPTAYYGFWVQEDSQLVLLNLTSGSWYWFSQEQPE